VLLVEIGGRRPPFALREGPEQEPARDPKTTGWLGCHTPFYYVEIVSAR
jgi:hypothetical protein